MPIKTWARRDILTDSSYLGAPSPHFRETHTLVSLQYRGLSCPSEEDRHCSTESGSLRPSRPFQPAEALCAAHSLGEGRGPRMTGLVREGGKRKESTLMSARPSRLQKGSKSRPHKHGCGRSLPASTSLVDVCTRALKYSIRLPFHCLTLSILL